MSKELIAQLGGPVAVAKVCHLKPNAVSNWNVRGIPWRFRPLIAERAEEMGVNLPEGFLTFSSESHAA